MIFPGGRPAPRTPLAKASGRRGGAAPRTPPCLRAPEFLVHSKMMLRILPRGLGAFVAARAGSADSKAPILIKIGGILNIVFVI